MVAEGGGIFVSYRRQESSHLAGRLADRLADRFGEGEVFIDVDTIEPGVDFADEIFRAVAGCSVLLAIIGPSWLTTTDERGRRRVDDPDDIVRLEVEAALARGVRVIPILVEGALMPVRHELPESLAGLARRNALLIRHETFRSDAARLITAIERILASTRNPTAVPGAAAPGRVQPAGSGRLRTARHLSDAEHSARAVTDERWKARTLVDIAKALIPLDPDRAAALVNDAEHIAGATADGPAKADALSAVARAVAATAPDRAERIIRSISDGSPEGRWHVVEALVELAGTLVVADPVRTAGLMADAEDLAGRITDDIYGPSALWGAARGLAAIDPDRAERVAARITAIDVRCYALADIAGVVRAADPGRATRLLAGAEGLLRSITDPTGRTQGQKVSALTHIAGSLATVDPVRAARLIADAERVAGSITDEVYGPSATQTLVQAMAFVDPDRAERLAWSIADEFWRPQALATVAQALGATDPDRAERLAAATGDAAATARALAGIAKELAAADPERAERVARSISDDLWRSRAYLWLAESGTPGS